MFTMYLCYVPSSSKINHFKLLVILKSKQAQKKIEKKPAGIRTPISSNRTNYLKTTFFKIYNLIFFNFE